MRIVTWIFDVTESIDQNLDDKTFERNVFVHLDMIRKYCNALHFIYPSLHASSCVKDHLSAASETSLQNEILSSVQFILQHSYYKRTRMWVLFCHLVGQLGQDQVFIILWPQTVKLSGSDCKRSQPASCIVIQQANHFQKSEHWLQNNVLSHLVFKMFSFYNLLVWLYLNNTYV